MKKIIVLIIAIFTIYIAKAQQYVPFPDSNAVWSEHHQFSISSGKPNYYYRNILTNKDTIVNSKTYHQLFYSLVDSTYNNIDTSLKYIGCIREANKQIYYLSKDSIHEYLLYDFSLNVGDTIKYDYSAFTFIYGWGKIDTLVVTSIDSILIYDASYRKRINFSTYNAGFTIPLNFIQWIEGIGNNMGLLFPIALEPTNGSNNWLLCYKQNDSLIYSSSSTISPYDCFPIIQQIHENILINQKISIYPNPVNDKLNIKTNSNAEQSIEITNLLGQTVYKNNIRMKGIVNTSAFAKGVYILKLSSDKETVVRKFVKE